MTNVDNPALDVIDISLLRKCHEKIGKQLSEVCADLGKKRSQRTLYTRFKRLEDLGLIRIDRSSERGRALYFVTAQGEEILGRIDAPHDNREASP